MALSGPLWSMRFAGVYGQTRRGAGRDARYGTLHLRQSGFAVGLTGWCMRRWLWGALVMAGCDAVVPALGKGTELSGDTAGLVEGDDTGAADGGAEDSGAADGADGNADGADGADGGVGGGTGADTGDTGDTGAADGSGSTGGESDGGAADGGTSDGGGSTGGESDGGAADGGTSDGGGSTGGDTGGDTGGTSDGGGSTGGDTGGDTGGSELTPDDGAAFCEAVVADPSLLDVWQTPGDGQVIFCHASGTVWRVIETAISACLPHASHATDYFPSTGCDS